MGGENKLVTKIAEEALDLMENIASTAENNINQKIFIINHLLYH